MSDGLKPHLVYLSRLYYDVVMESELGLPRMEQKDDITSVVLRPLDEQVQFRDYYKYIKSIGYLASCYDQYESSHDDRLLDLDFINRRRRAGIIWTLASLAYGQTTMTFSQEEEVGLLARDIRNLGIVYTDANQKPLEYLSAHLWILTVKSGIVHSFEDPRFLYRRSDGEMTPFLRYRLTDPSAGSGDYDEPEHESSPGILKAQPRFGLLY